MTPVFEHIRTSIALALTKVWELIQLEFEINGKIITACLVCKAGESALFKHWSKLVPSRYLSRAKNMERHHKRWRRGRSEKGRNENTLSFDAHVATLLGSRRLK